MNSEHKAAVIIIMIICMAATAIAYILTDHIVKRETQLVRALEVTEMLQRAGQGGGSWRVKR